jgi:hypothetical protein
MRRAFPGLVLPALLALGPAAGAQDVGADPAAEAALHGDVEALRAEALAVERELLLLEEELLFPPSSRLAVYFSMDLGELFELQSVEVKLNGEPVAAHFYTDKQLDALFRGGVQPLYLGNVRQGDNELAAFFTGVGPSGRPYRRATSVRFEKDFEPIYVELTVTDSEAKRQPEFQAAVRR